MTTIPRIADSEKDLTQRLDWEGSDSRVYELMEGGDIDGAREEVERTLLDSLDSGEGVAITPEKWEELRLAFHREAKIAS
jgi:hypothetical protein